jgi:hypothetical protein
VAERSTPALVLTAFFGLRVAGALGSVALGQPFLVYQPPYWRTLLIYGGGGSYVSYLCWRRLPRARFAAYICLTVDVIRALRGHYWWVFVLDVAVVLLMQLPAFRAVYPALQPGHILRRRRPRGDVTPNDGPGQAMGC